MQHSVEDKVTRKTAREFKSTRKRDGLARSLDGLVRVPAEAQRKSTGGAGATPRVVPAEAKRVPAVTVDVIERNSPLGAGNSGLSLAGWWHALISVPFFQFLLLRWYFRGFIWARFLWQMSRLDLQLVPTHPDRVGGLGFLTNVVYAFTPILLAHGALLSGLIADRIFFDGAKLPQFMVEIVGGVAVLVLLVLFPLMVFAGQLARLKRTGLADYGRLAQRYVREFDQKWLRGSEPGEPLIGSPDIQSLADLANSFEVVRQVRFVPFSKETVAPTGDRHAGAGGAAAADDDLLRRAPEASAERGVLNAAPRLH